MTSATVDQHQLACIFCAVPTCLDPAALKESLASLPVRVNSMEWFLRWLMACFLRRCAEFVTRATIEHYLLTDSSSARQLAARQGVGKIKHLSAKILWIQNLVQEKAIILSQISTVWNVADAGTKVLSSKRLRLLLHQLGVFLRFGDERVGQEEFQENFTTRWWT